MCLALSKPYKHPRKGKGYKVFIRDVDIDEGISYTYAEFLTFMPYEIGKWYTATPKYDWQSNPEDLEDDNGQRYASGYHIFTKLEDAKLWRAGSPYKELREVEYEDARTGGYQFSRRTGHCVVAQRMKIGKVIMKSRCTLT